MFSSGRPLFDSSSSILGQETITSLHQNVSCLTTLHTVLSAIKDSTDNITNLGSNEMDSRVTAVSLLKLHLEAVLWFYHCGLLPQCSLEEVIDDSSVPFPVEVLHMIYQVRLDMNILNFIVFS